MENISKLVHLCFDFVLQLIVLKRPDVIELLELNLFILLELVVLLIEVTDH